MNGKRSLNTGAVDLRLTGDQTQRGSYVQRRRNQMAYGGIAGLDGRKRYGIGSWFQEKIMDPIKKVIPNEIKNPAALATIAGLGINQFGIPGMDKAGQGWIQDLIGGATDMIGTGVTKAKDFLTPGTFPDYSGVTGVFRPGQTAEMGGNPLRTLLDVTGVFRPGQTAAMGGNPLNPVEFAKQQGLNLVGNQLGLNTVKGLGETLFGDTTRTGQEPFNWKIPVAGGLAAGAYTASQPRDVHPADTTGINFQTGAEAMADPTQRFKPKEEYANVAEGGRIGYDEGGSTWYNPLSWFSGEDVEEKVLGKDTASKLKKKRDRLKELQEQLKAQGGRIGYRYGQGVESVPTDQMEAIKGQTAGPDWFTRRVQDLMQFEGLSYEEASDQAYEEGPAGGTDYAQGGRIGYADELQKFQKNF